MKWHTTTMQLEFDETQGVLLVDPHPDFTGKETVENAEENIRTSVEYSGDKLTGILAVMPNHYISAEVTRYYKQHVPHVPIAMIAKSFFQKMMGNFLLSMAAPKRPTKLFTEKEEGLKWLEIQKKAVESKH